jgi:hypothetical protein
VRVRTRLSPARVDSNLCLHLPPAVGHVEDGVLGPLVGAKLDHELRSECATEDGPRRHPEQDEARCARNDARRDVVPEDERVGEHRGREERIQRRGYERMVEKAPDRSRHVVARPSTRSQKQNREDSTESRSSHRVHESDRTRERRPVREQKPLDQAEERDDGEDARREPHPLGRLTRQPFVHVVEERERHRDRAQAHRQHREEPAEHVHGRARHIGERC